jgi:hypothetical protein
LAVDQVLSMVSTSLSIPILTLLPTMHDIGKLRVNYFFLRICQWYVDGPSA